MRWLLRTKVPIQENKAYAKEGPEEKEGEV